MPNRLASQASSYLRSAAHQPVDWQPWGEAAFAEAKAQDKPILLDIGAVWCHWCHVMDRESYEDAEIAALINQLYVPVKVDRDERPDVDTRYQKAIQSITGQGGWPLTAFLLPDGRVFYGGTYFPPRDAHGRPSFRRVLESVADAYHTRKDEILANADHLSEHLTQRRAAARGGAPAPEEWGEIVAGGALQLRESFDVQNGGFGQAPKFPHASAVDLLIERAVQGDHAARDMALATLRAMRDGGIYDQLAGGFHRYSVDAKWIVPHFEKMLYDNAGLLRNYVRAARAFDAPDLMRTADEIVAWMRDVLRQPSGAFGGSQDADIDLDDDGDHFTWTLEELAAAVPDEPLRRLMAAHYDVREKGDMHHDEQRCVLRVAADEEALAAAFKLDVERVRARLQQGKALMMEARRQRPTPFVDPLQYTSWNGMAIQALLERGSPEADAMALAALDAFLRESFEPDRGWQRTLGRGPFGLLDDNAQMLDALLEAHLVTGDERYVRGARQTGEVILLHFRHPDGGFADRAPALAPPAESMPLASPERPVQDAPTASANGVALRAMLRLADATGEERWAQEARAALVTLARDAAQLGLFGGALLLALDAAARPPPRVVLAGGAVAAPYRAATRAYAKPGATLARAEDPGVPEEARAFPGEGALVCLGQRCLAPARAPDELAARLREARAG